MWKSVRTVAKAEKPGRLRVRSALLFSGDADASLTATPPDYAAGPSVGPVWDCLLRFRALPVAMGHVSADALARWNIPLGVHQQRPRKRRARRRGDNVAADFAARQLG